MELTDLARRIRRMVPSAIFCMVAATVAFAAPQTRLDKAPLPELPPDVWSQLRAGEVVILEKEWDDPDAEFKMADVVELTLLEMPPELVFQQVSDSSKHPEFMPYVENSTLRDEAGDSAQVLAQRWYWETWFFVTSVNFETIVLIDRNNLVVEWELNKYVENDLSETSGHWWLYPLEGGTQTLLVYAARGVAEVPLPMFLVQYSLEQGAKDLLQNMRYRVLSGGTWKKGDDPPLSTAGVN